MASASPNVSEKFHSENNNFITATDEINANDLETYIKERIRKGDFLSNTKFVLVAGSHHYIDEKGEVVPGKTDYVLLQGFEQKFFSNLQKMKDDEGNLIWDKMNFSEQLVTIACTENPNYQPPFNSTYELSERSQRNLTILAEDLCNQNNPFCVIFASCYSYQSPLKDFLIEKGILAAIDISKDRGEITGGRIFALDKDQKEINDALREDPTKSLLLWGSSGTGKTLALVAALKGKVSYYKRRKIPYKVLVLSYSTQAEHLLEDFKTKYGLHTILDENGIVPIHLKQLEYLKSYGFDFQENDPLASLKSLIDAIHAKNETENNNYKWLILIDEIQVFRHKSDLTTLHLKKDIEIMAAINPNGAWQSCITPPMDKRFIFQRLTFKHRNSLEISIFIAHWKYESRLLDLAYKFKDEPLLASSFPAIDKNFVNRRNPVWILANSKRLEYVEILEQIKKRYCLPSDKNVVLLHRKFVSKQDQFTRVLKWCQEQNWETALTYKFIGSEASTIILFNTSNPEFEAYSRARDLLIIVEMFGFENQQTVGLRKVSMHQNEHNCEVCTEEENKSTSLRITATRLIDRVILPSNECWLCNITFQDTESQVTHFAKHHECELCYKYFGDISEKRKHSKSEHSIHECEFCYKYFHSQSAKRFHKLQNIFQKNCSKNYESNESSPK